MPKERSRTIVESPDEVRASVSVEALASLRDHEETSEAREAEVGRLLAESGTFSWPLVVDADSGLILDGSHRARVLGRGGRAAFVPVQRVSLDHPGLRVDVWCRVIDRVSLAAFETARRRFDLVRLEGTGLLCRYRGESYGRADLEPAAGHALARDLAHWLSTDGGDGSDGGDVRLLAEEELPTASSSDETVVVRPPTLDVATIRARARVGRLPYKATRFVLPFRVLGLPVPLGDLAGSRTAIAERVRESLDTPLVCLGPGLSVDRRYPEPLWQPASYRIPRRLFAQPDDHARYEAARDRGAARAHPLPCSTR
jgi:hypothetical protein